MQGEGLRCEQLRGHRPLTCYIYGGSGGSGGAPHGGGGGGGRRQRQVRKALGHGRKRQDVGVADGRRRRLGILHERSAAFESYLGQHARLQAEGRAAHADT